NPFARPVVTDVVQIPPGGRAEVLARAGEPGRYALHAVPADHGVGIVSAHTVLATLDVLPDRRPRRPFQPEPLLAPFCDLRRLPVDKQRTITMSMTGGFKNDGT